MRNCTPLTEMLDVKSVAKLLGCSTRHVYRLVDRGAMPAPVRLGALIRWPRNVLDEWIGRGCPAVRRAEGHTRPPRPRHPQSAESVKEAAGTFTN